MDRDERQTPHRLWQQTVIHTPPHQRRPNIQPGRNNAPMAMDLSGMHCIHLTTEISVQGYCILDY